MIYFYGTKEQAKGITIDSFASSSFKEVIGDASLVYTDDKTISANYESVGVKVEKITKPKQRTTKK